MERVAESVSELRMPGMRTLSRSRGLEVVSDEPESLSGTDSGPTPMEMLLSSLGACTAMTIAMYAGRKGWGLESVRVAVGGYRGEGEAGPYERLEVDVSLVGELSEAERSRIMGIAERCPVHRTLSGGVDIATRAVPA